jgi:hypothetical protein
MFLFSTSGRLCLDGGLQRCLFIDVRRQWLMETAGCATQQKCQRELSYYQPAPNSYWHLHLLTKY